MSSYLVNKVKNSFYSDKPKCFKSSWDSEISFGTKYYIQNKNYRLVKDDYMWDIENCIDYFLYESKKVLFIFTRWVRISEEYEDVDGKTCDELEELFDTFWSYNVFSCK